VSKSLCYDYPLRPDYLVQLVIPRDLTQREADRLCEFIQATVDAINPVHSPGDPPE
jgi:hypothetical protein